MEQQEAIDDLQKMKEEQAAEIERLQRELEANEVARRAESASYEVRLEAIRRQQRPVSYPSHSYNLRQEQAATLDRAMSRYREKYNVKSKPKLINFSASPNPSPVLAAATLAPPTTPALQAMPAHAATPAPVATSTPAPPYYRGGSAPPTTPAASGASTAPATPAAPLYYRGGTSNTAHQAAPAAPLYHCGGSGNPAATPAAHGAPAAPTAPAPAAGPTPGQAPPPATPAASGRGLQVCDFGLACTRPDCFRVHTDLGKKDKIYNSKFIGNDELCSGNGASPPCRSGAGGRCCSSGPRQQRHPAERPRPRPRQRPEEAGGEESQRLGSTLQVSPVNCHTTTSHFSQNKIILSNTGLIEKVENEIRSKTEVVENSVDVVDNMKLRQEEFKRRAKDIFKPLNIKKEDVSRAKIVDENLTLMSVNCRSLNNKKSSIKNILESTNADFVVLQELNCKSMPQFPGHINFTQLSNKNSTARL